MKLESEHTSCCCERKVAQKDLESADKRSLRKKLANVSEMLIIIVELRTYFKRNSLGAKIQKIMNKIIYVTDPEFRRLRSSLFSINY